MQQSGALACYPKNVALCGFLCCLLVDLLLVGQVMCECVNGVIVTCCHHPPIKGDAGNRLGGTGNLARLP